MPNPRKPSRPPGLFVQNSTAGAVNGGFSKKCILGVVHCIIDCGNKIMNTPKSKFILSHTLQRFTTKTIISDKGVVTDVISISIYSWDALGVPKFTLP
jgi:hypothetical protein